MENRSKHITKWMIGVLIIAAAAAILTLTVAMFYNQLKLIDMKSGAFTQYQSLNFIPAGITLLVYSIWWWGNACRKKYLTQEAYKRGRTTAIILTVVLCAAAEAVISFIVKFRNYESLFLCVLLSVAVYSIAAVVSAVKFGEY